MRRREFLGILGGAAAWPVALKAQQAELVRRVGMLNISALDPKRTSNVQRVLRLRQTRAIQTAVGFVVRKWKALVRADCCKADDVTIRAYSIRDALTEFEQYSGCIAIWITDIERSFTLSSLTFARRLLG